MRLATPSLLAWVRLCMFFVFGLWRQNCNINRQTPSHNKINCWREAIYLTIFNSPFVLAKITDLLNNPISYQMENIFQKILEAPWSWRYPSWLINQEKWEKKITLYLYILSSGENYFNAMYVLNNFFCTHSFRGVMSYKTLKHFPVL